MLKKLKISFRNISPAKRAIDNFIHSYLAYIGLNRSHINLRCGKSYKNNEKNKIIQKLDIVT
jgi:hypothetical protein